MKSVFSRVLAALCILIGISANQIACAGGILPHPDSVVFENGLNTVRPGTKVKINFRVTQYVYGSDKFAYTSIGIAPSITNINKVRAADAKNWAVLGILISVPSNPKLDSTDFDTPFYTVTFSAPIKPGRYKVLLGGVPKFAPFRRPHDAKLWESFYPTAVDRNELIESLFAYRGMIRHVAEFIVSDAAPQVSENPTIYLRLNGKVPGYADNIGGLQKTPVTFSWNVGPEFNRKNGNIRYRYKFSPYDENFGAWVDETQVSYAFLQKGIHEFKVEARYTNGNITLISQPASYRFNVAKEHIAQPASKGFIGPVPPPKVNYSDVYKKSRALLVGMWGFSDEDLPRFDQAKIQKDIKSMTEVLEKNGFEVSVLSKERVSRDEIIKALSSLVGSAQRDDRLFIYFSTHGFADPSSPTEGYLATSECHMTEPEVKCLKLKDLEHYARKALESQDAKQVLFAIDSCFSGLGVVQKSGASSLVNLSQLAVPKGAFMLTAGMSTQTAQIDPALGMSTFAHYLVKGLDGEGDLMKNGLMTLSQLFVYVQWQVAKQTDSKQIPMIGKITGDGEMLFWPSRSKFQGADN